VSVEFDAETDTASAAGEFSFSHRWVAAV